MLAIGALVGNYCQRKINREFKALSIHPKLPGGRHLFVW